MAAQGAMAQIGLKAAKIWGNPSEEPDLQDTLSAFCRASGVVERLKGSVFGLIGWPKHRHEHGCRQHAGVDATLRDRC